MKKTLAWYCIQEQPIITWQLGRLKRGELTNIKAEITRLGPIWQWKVYLPSNPNNFCISLGYEESFWIAKNQVEKYLG